METCDSAEADRFEPMNYECEKAVNSARSDEDRWKKVIKNLLLMDDLANSFGAGFKL
jgi:hypothetical protein